MPGKIEGGRRRDDRDVWMASLILWTWDLVNSGSWWWTGRPGVLRFMGSQRVNMTEQLKWTELIFFGMMSIENFACFLIEFVLTAELLEVPYIFCIQVLCQLSPESIFSSLQLAFFTLWLQLCAKQKIKNLVMSNLLFFKKFRRPYFEVI